MVKAFPSSAWERGVFFLGTPVVVLAIRRETVLSSSPDIPIRIYYVPWLIPTYARAQAWWTVILVKRGVRLTESLLAHELAHVLQWHPLETVAHLAAQDDDFLNWAREIIKTKKRTGPS
jgi:hypothetical protein